MLCLWRQSPWLRAFSFVGGSPQELLLVTLKKQQAYLQASSAGELMNMGTPVLLSVGCPLREERFMWLHHVTVATGLPD